MSQELIQFVESHYKKSKLPDVRPGDTVKVKVAIVEGSKERLQAYEGIVIKISGEGLRRSITVRKVFQGIKVERVFPLHAPRVNSIEIIRRGRVRRAKLYYLRERIGKAARIRERQTSLPGQG